MHNYNLHYINVYTTTLVTALLDLYTDYRKSIIHLSLLTYVINLTGSTLDTPSIIKYLQYFKNITITYPITYVIIYNLKIHYIFTKNLFH